MFLQAGCPTRVHNFSSDIKDSVAYGYLLQQIAPKESGVQSKNLVTISDLTQRAEGVLGEADKIGCRSV